MQQIAYLAFKV